MKPKKKPITLVTYEKTGGVSKEFLNQTRNKELVPVKPKNVGDK